MTLPWPVILASQSPRRHELLASIGLDFEIENADIDESHGADDAPEDLVCRLAHEKARVIAERNPGSLVIGSDTIVFDDLVIGKPDNQDHARNILSGLSGHTHHVYTGVSIQCRSAGVDDTWFDVTAVHFRELTGDIITSYMRSANVLDKAGAYGIQEHGDMIIDGIDGYRSTVMGLPIERLEERLRNLGGCT